MGFEVLIEKLDKFAKTINSSVIGLSIFEGILVIVIGVVSSNLTTENAEINKICLWILLLSSFFYLVLLLIRTAYIYNFPGSISNELKSERELRDLKNDTDRQNTINEFFVSTIQKLNGQTCALNYQDDTHLCDKGIQNGIRELIEPIIDNAYFLLDTINSKFTFGIYLDHYLSRNIDGESEQGILVIDDKLGKEYLLEKGMFMTAYLRGEKLEIQSAITTAFNNSEFVKKDYVGDDNIKYTIVCSPMPYACDELDMQGVLFIISKEVKNIPNDLATKLKIFNRVISNWVYRYNQCIESRYQAKINSNT